MPSRQTLFPVEPVRKRRGPLKKYELSGTSEFSFWEDTDLNAFKTLADFLKIPFPVTLERFRLAGGKRLVCEGRQVFPLRGDA